MKNAVIGVVLVGIAAWFGLAYFELAAGPAPWELLLPKAVLKSNYAWIFILGGFCLIWLVWDRFSKGS